MTSKQIEKPHWKVKKRNRQSLFKSLQKREQEGEKISETLVKQSKPEKHHSSLLFQLLQGGVCMGC